MIKHVLETIGNTPMIKIPNSNKITEGQILFNTNVTILEGALKIELRST